MKKTLLGALALVLLFFSVPRPALSCCGVNPYIDSMNIALNCFNVPGAVTGTIKGVEEWYDAYSTGPVTVQVEILSPSGVVTNLNAVLSNLQEFPSGSNINSYATWDYNAGPYTPEEVGTYTCVVKVWWTSAFGWVMSNSSSQNFEVSYCTTPGNVIGAGWLMTSTIKNTFGFSAQSLDGETVMGSVEFQAHQSLNLKSTAINTLYVDGNLAVITGECRINGEDGFTFVLMVEDNGAPGKDADKFTISWDPSVNGFSSVGGTIDQGNIKIN